MRIVTRVHMEAFQLTTQHAATLNTLVNASNLQQVDGMVVAYIVDCLVELNEGAATDFHLKVMAAKEIQHEHYGCFLAG